jgi:enoyl-CoA hydratase
MADHYNLSTIQSTLDQGVLRVMLNRPERRNAVNGVMHDELRQLFGRIAEDHAVQVVVLTGAGKSFCAGGDFQAMGNNLAGGGYEDGHPSLMTEAAAMARNILAVRQPMVAAVNGDAMGLGATLALFCDISLMAEGARIGDPHVNAGLVAGDGGAVLWPMLMGANRAKEFLMLGDMLTATEAERLGLINHAVPPAELESRAMAMARRLAEGPQHAIRFNKRLVNKELEDRVSRLYDLSLALEGLTFYTKDHKEAVSAFLEKRKPRYGK